MRVVFFFWVNLRRLGFVWRRFETPSSIFIDGVSLHHLWRRKRVFRTSAHKIQTPGIRQKRRIQHSEQGEILNSRIKWHFYPLWNQFLIVWRPLEDETDIIGLVWRKIWSDRYINTVRLNIPSPANMRHLENIIIMSEVLTAELLRFHDVTLCHRYVITDFREQYLLSKRRKLRLASQETCMVIIQSTSNDGVQTYVTIW